MSAMFWLAATAAVLTGVVFYVFLFSSRRPGDGGAALGYGTVLGMLASAAATSLAAREDTTHAWLHALPWLAIVVAIAAVVGWQRFVLRAAAAEPGIPQPRIRTWHRVVLAGLYATLVMRAWLAAREIWLRPLYPWDAWSAWAVKGKTWFLLGHHVPFVSGHEWLFGKNEGAHTAVAWFYPDATSWLDVWFASAAGGWIEPLIRLPWLMLWIALLLGHYGQWRALGMDRLRALFFIYVLGSLPLLTVHVALAGYADIWVATLFALSVLAWMQWLHHGERRQLALAMLCAMTLPFLKVEGWVWASCLYCAFALAALPMRWRRVALAAIALAVAFIVLGGLRIAFVHLGWVDAATGAVVNPAIGPFNLLLRLSWRGSGAAGIAEALFSHPNWHLLWWLLPLVLVWRWKVIAGQRWLCAPTLLLFACLAAVAFLFTFTDATDWAQNFTAINRLVLQISPACVSVLALLLRDLHWPEAARDTAPASAPRNDPG